MKMQFNKDREELDYYAQESQSGICPICCCNGVEYGSTETLDDCNLTDWVCQNCGAVGQEYDKLIFDGHIVKAIPDKSPSAVVYADGPGNLYFVRSGVGMAYKGYRRNKMSKTSARREVGVQALPYQENRDIAQYQLDAFARKNGFHVATQEEKEACQLS